MTPILLWFFEFSLAPFPLTLCWPLSLLSCLNLLVVAVSIADKMSIFYNMIKNSNKGIFISLGNTYEINYLNICHFYGIALIVYFWLSVVLFSWMIFTWMAYTFTFHLTSIMFTTHIPVTLHSSVFSLKILILINS